MGSSDAPGSSYGAGGKAAAVAKQAAGRAALAIGSGLLSGSRLIAKGVRAALADNSDKEAVRFLKFAELEWSGECSGEGGLGGGGGSSTQRRLPVLLVGLATGFQVWRLDGPNPAELVSRRDAPVKLMEALPQPRCTADDEACDALCADRPLLAVVPTAEPLPGPSYSGASRAAGAAAQQAKREQQQHIVQLYSLRSHCKSRTLSFSSEVLGLQASGRLLVVALRGQLQAFDAATLQHTFSCLTYVPPPPPLRQASRGGSVAVGQRQPAQQQQQFVTEGLASSTSSAGSEAAYQLQTSGGAAADAAAAQPPAATLAPFALGPRWLAYAADTPVPAASGQAVAQRLPLARRDSAGSRASGGAEGEAGSGTGLTRAAVADAALQAAAKGGQQLRAGLTAVGSASFRYLSQQYTSWRQGPLDQVQQQREADASEADAAVAGTVVVRDVASRLVVAHFRAHTSPLAALQFTPCGRLLATASTAGHSINVFAVVPPPLLPGSAAGEDGSFGSGLGAGGGLAGHAVWLYRLYRGVTPASIRGIAFAPDASWVAVSSGRGTTHVFHTPAAAPGASGAGSAQQQQAQQQAGTAAETAVLGCPPKLSAVARARKPGLLSGGVAGAATSAARNLYAGQPADVEPIAAAFLATGPGSPKAVAPAASGSGGSLYLVTCDGLLTRHLLLAPPAAAGASGAAPVAPAAAQDVSAGLTRQDSAAAAAAGSSVAAVLEEADRWDVARHASWPEREELLPGLLNASPAPAARSPAEQQQLWVGQAECGALDSGGAEGTAGTAPLWRDPQFRCYEIHVQGLHVASAAPGAGPEAGDALAAQLQAAGLDGSSSGGGDAPWLEDLPTRPVQPPQ